MTPAEIERAGAVVIIRAGAGADLPGLCRALAEGGVRALEITLNTPGAVGAIGQARDMLGGRCRVGAGTVLSGDDVRQAVSAGAEFIVTPTVQPESIAAAREQGMPVICGAATPAELLAAHRAGASFLKLFPAHRFGPAYVRDVLAPMPFLKIIPTGGVTSGNVADWVRAGATAVAVGSEIVDPQLVAAGDWDGITRRARAFMTILARSRAAACA